MPRWSIQGLDKENLQDLYEIKRYTLKQIGAETGHDERTVSHYLEKHNIPVRSHGEAVKGRVFNTKVARVLPKRKLEELYVNQFLTTAEIARRAGCTRDSVVLRLHKYGIPLHSSKIKGLDKATLERLYIGKQWSTVQIARYLSCHDESVRKALQRNNIPIRSKSEAGRVKIMTPEHLAKLREGARKVNLGKIGPKHHAWKGGRQLNSYGYIMLRIDKKYVLEHRHIMEQHLGRKLQSWEEVNHINGIRADNRLENLEIIVSEHKRRDYIRRNSK